MKPRLASTLASLNRKARAGCLSDRGAEKTGYRYQRTVGQKPD